MEDSELALWKEWASGSDERKELLPCPLLETVKLANKRAQRRPLEAPTIKAALGVIQSGWWTQEVASKAGIAQHPFCLNCGPDVLGSAQHRLWACPSLSRDRMDLPPTPSASGTDRDWWQTQVGERPDARPCREVHSWTHARWYDSCVVHPSVVGNSLGGKLFVDGSLMCKHGSQGGQAGWAVAANPRDFPRAGLLSSRCHADLAPSTTAYPAGGAVGTVAGHHLVGTRSNVRV